MSVRIMGAVFYLDLAPVDKLVLLAMADHAEDDGSKCFPSIGRLAKKTSLTRRGVQKVIRRLEQNGQLKPVGRRSEGMIEYAIRVEGGEPYSRGERGSQRTVCTEGANLSALGGERGSPESSLTVLNRQIRPDLEDSVRSVWAHYLQKLEKNPKINTLSDKRKKKGIARLKDALEMAGGDLPKAEALMKAAVDALAASEFHRGVNDRRTKYQSWEDNLFKDREQFENWLGRAE